MAQYFMHLRDSIDELLDPEGTDFADLDALKLAVLVNARDLIAGDLRNGLIDLRYRIDAEDELGNIVYSLPFRHAFSIIPEPAGSHLTPDLG
jgi:hypothetical protein